MYSCLGFALYIVIYVSGILIVVKCTTYTAMLCVSEWNQAEKFSLSPSAPLILLNSFWNVAMGNIIFKMTENAHCKKQIHTV